MTVPDWSDAHAREALGRIGRTHLNAATVALLVCPKQHILARVIATNAGPLYLADVVMPPLHSTGRRALGGPVERARTTVLALHTPAYLAAMETAGQADRWPASCDCGLWDVPHPYVVEIAKTRRRTKRMVVDSQRVRRTDAPAQQPLEPCGHASHASSIGMRWGFHADGSTEHCPQPCKLIST